MAARRRNRAQAMRVLARALTDEEENMPKVLTEAGRDYLEGVRAGYTGTLDRAETAVPRIEAEAEQRGRVDEADNCAAHNEKAVAAERARIAEEVEGLPEAKVRDHVTGRLYGTGQVSRAAVLDAVTGIANPCHWCHRPKSVHGTDGRRPNACEWDMQTMYYLSEADFAALPSGHVIRTFSNADIISYPHRLPPQEPAR